METAQFGEKTVEWKLSDGYLRCLTKAIEHTHQLLVRSAGSPNADQIHAVKSVLYAAIERAWIESERILGVQRMLRELLMLTTIRGASEFEDREQALRVLGKLASSHPSR